jgi:hypothetical protein
MDRREPFVDARTAGLLGPARSSGSSVVIVTFNNQGCIGDCLHSVLMTLDDHDEVIVVDNASTDGTVGEVRRFQQWTRKLTLVESDTNLGYSAGANVGLRASAGTHLVLLNPDTTVWPRWLEKMKRAVGEDVGAVAPISDNVGGAQFVGGLLRPGIPLHEIQDHLTECFSGVWEETKLLFGLCVMLPRSLLDRIGLLDEDLFLGNDDLELSWRIRTHELKLLIVEDVFVHHLNHVSFNSLSGSKVHDLVAESSKALDAKLSAYYGRSPTSEEVWGVTFRS